MNVEHKKNGDIILHTSKDDLIELSELEVKEGFDFDSDRVMFDFFDSFIGNSEFDWIAPETIGALTSAPILATFGDNDNDTGDRDVVDAYGFMDYAVISLQRQLLDYGQAVFTKG